MSSAEETGDDPLRSPYLDGDIDAALTGIGEAISNFRQQHPNHLDLSEAVELAEFCGTAVKTLRKFREAAFAKTKGELGEGGLKLLNPGVDGPTALLEVLGGVLAYVEARNRIEKDMRIAAARIAFEQMLRFGQPVARTNAVSNECTRNQPRKKLWHSSYVCVPWCGRPCSSM